MQTPLQFFPPEKYRNLVVVSHLTPEDFPYPIYFASSVLQQWGANRDNYILEQRYIRDLVGLSLVTICVKERTRIAIACNREFNSVQSTLSGNCIAYLQGYGFMLLVSRTYTFQYIPEGRHEIWLEPNVYHFLYILLSDAQLKELGIAHGITKLDIERLKDIAEILGTTVEDLINVEDGVYISEIKNNDVGFNNNSVTINHKSELKKSCMKRSSRKKIR